MAPKKDKGIFASFKDEDQYYADFKQKLYDGFHAQKTNLDKLSYIMELSAMASDLAIIRARLKKVPSEVNREDYDSEEEYRQALEQETERNKNEFFSEEEKAELGFSDQEQAKRLEKIVNDTLDDCYRQYKLDRKESDLEQGVMGILRGQTAVSAGKYFKELQESDLLKDDPNRDLKLQYIAGSTEGLPYHSVGGGIQGMQTSTMMGAAFDSEFGPDIEKTPLGNVEALKKMTVGQLLGHFHLANNVYEEILTGFAKETEREKETVRNANAYEILMETYERSSTYKNDRELNPNKTQQEKEKDMIGFVKNSRFRKGEQASRRIHGMKMYEAIRTDEELSLYPTGLSIIDADYSKGLAKKYDSEELDSDQLHRELDPIVRKGRAGRFKQRLRHYDEQLEKAQKPLHMDREEPYAQMFPPVNKADKSYDNYIRLHSGVYAMNTKRDYKELLAKVLAAEALKNSGQAFSVKKVRQMAKSIQKLPALQNAKNDEIVAALSTDPQKLKDLQQSVYLASFAVKPENAGKYVEDMKKLQASMMSSRKRSPEYQKFASAVAEVARLKPGSEGFEAASRKANEALLKSINVYSQDKEKVRFLDDGVARFDNTMDALSIMKDNIPGISDVIDARVSAINKTRKAESVDHKDHLDLTKYGAERAQAEYAKRTGQPAEEKEQVKVEDGPVLS